MHNALCADVVRMTAVLEYIVETDEVVVDKRVELLNRIADACLRYIKLIVLKCTVNKRLVRKDCP